MASEALLLGIFAAVVASALALVWTRRYRDKVRIATKENTRDPCRDAQYECDRAPLLTAPDATEPDETTRRNARRERDPCIGPSDVPLDVAKRLFQRVQESSSMRDYRTLLQCVDDSLFGSMVIHAIASAHHDTSTRITSLQAERVDAGDTPDPARPRVRFTYWLANDVAKDHLLISETWTLRREPLRPDGWVLYAIARDTLDAMTTQRCRDESSGAPM